MKKFAVLSLFSLLFLAGCFGSGGKSPDAVEQQTSGSYKRVYIDDGSAVVIAGARNNFEFGGAENFREIFSWQNEKGEKYEMDFSDDASPLYILGRNGIVYLAVKVSPGKYNLSDFSLKGSQDGASYEADFKNRYQASFEISDAEVIFIGILKTSYDSSASQEFNETGATKLKVSTVLENGKEDLYRITNFYSIITKHPVKTNIMYWNDAAPGKTETLVYKQKN